MEKFTSLELAKEQSGKPLGTDEAPSQPLSGCHCLSGARRQTTCSEFEAAPSGLPVDLSRRQRQLAVGLRRRPTVGRHSRGAELGCWRKRCSSAPTVAHLYPPTCAPAVQPLASASCRPSPCWPPARPPEAGPAVACVGGISWRELGNLLGRKGLQSSSVARRAHGSV